MIRHHKKMNFSIRRKILNHQDGVLKYESAFWYQTGYLRYSYQVKQVFQSPPVYDNLKKQNPINKIKQNTHDRFGTADPFLVKQF